MIEVGDGVLWKGIDLNPGGAFVIDVKVVRETTTTTKGLFA